MAVENQFRIPNTPKVFNVQTHNSHVNISEVRVVIATECMNAAMRKGRTHGINGVGLHHLQCARRRILAVIELVAAGTSFVTLRHVVRLPNSRRVKSANRGAASLNPMRNAYASPLAALGMTFLGSG